MAGTRSTVSGSFMFNLQGVPCGFVRSAEGGDVVGEVVEEGPKSGAFRKKHIGQVKYDAVQLSFGFDMTPDIYEWIEASWKQNYSRKDGSIVVTDPSFQAVSAREFYHALITEATIPDLDASSKDAAHLTLKFAPEYTRDVKASGKVTAPKTSAQKQFVASNFRFELDELPGARVSRIDSFTVKQPVVTDDIGSVRDAPVEPGRIDFPNLRVTISELDAGPWSDWVQDFLVKGNNDDTHEKSGAIVFLSPNRKTELARILLHNVGIFALRREAAPTGSQISHIVADLYCERMDFSPRRGVAGVPS
ncbi:MAG: phage tail protein [Gaiellaceae bacterium]